MPHKIEQHGMLWIQGTIKFKYVMCVFVVLTATQHVSRVLDMLEYVWRHMALYGGVDYDELEAMLSSNLVP